ncbi:MAG: ABC transporter permease [Acholeplasmataceae bacterium]
MKKLKFLIAYGIKKRVFRKAFLIANIVIALILIALVNLPTIIEMFSGDGDDQVEYLEVDVINQTDEAAFASELEDFLNASYEGYRFYRLEDAGESFDEEAFWEDEDRHVVLHFTGEYVAPEVTIYSKHTEYNDILTSEIELFIIEEQLDGYERPEFDFEYAPEHEDPEEAMALNSIMTFLVLPLFILITMATQFVGVDIIEEKSTKAIETIISSVPAKLHFLSKITASIAFVAIQGGLLIVYGAIANLVAGTANTLSSVSTEGESLLNYLAELIPNWPAVLVFTVFFILFGSLFFLVFAALFASIATTQEDYQQFQSPIMLLLLSGFYITIFAPMAGASGFMKVTAFIPIFTPMVAPVAFASGVLTVWEALIALLVVIAFTVLAIYGVAPVYRVSILSYDQTSFMKRIRKYLKKAKRQ